MTEQHIGLGESVVGDLDPRNSFACLGEQCVRFATAVEILKSDDAIYGDVEYEGITEEDLIRARCATGREERDIKDEACPFEEWIQAHEKGLA